jgi:hypothetical protein
MKHKLLLTLALLLLSYGSLAQRASAASHTSRLTGGGWTLTIIAKQAPYGLTMTGSFRSANRSFKMSGDWIPAGDAGSDLLRFYGHPFGPKSPMGLVGVATLTNTCNPNCAASKHDILGEVSGLPQLNSTLPGVGKRSIILKYQG